MRFITIATFCLVALFQVNADDNATSLDTFPHCVGECQNITPDWRSAAQMRRKEIDYEECVTKRLCPLPNLFARSNEPCINGTSANRWECSNVDLLSFMPLPDMGSIMDGNDIWGWTDPQTGREYALAGAMEVTSIVDVTDPMSPVLLGVLPTHTEPSIWRDIKVYNNYAFIGSEAPGHGMQVFDLKQLRGLEPMPDGQLRLFKESAHYGEFGSSHNIVSNEETGYIYAVGSDTCNQGLHMVNVQNPLQPVFAGCYGDDGYVHDAQCIVYSGPDQRFRGEEICFCYNEDTLTIVNVQNKQKPEMLARVSYNRAYYTHQGWLTEDQRHLLLDDELDEMSGPNPFTRTLIWNVDALTDPLLVNSFYSTEKAIDHNLYIRGRYAYQSNYCAGLRILDVDKIADGDLVEVGYFDVAPECDEPVFFGSWSSYPYFPSKNIIVQGIRSGLFVLRFNKPN